MHQSTSARVRLQDRLHLANDGSGCTMRPHATHVREAHDHADGAYGHHTRLIFRHPWNLYPLVLNKQRRRVLPPVHGNKV